MIIKYRIFIYIISILFCSCRDNKEGPAVATDKKNIPATIKHAVAILPFNGIDKDLVADLKKGMQEKLDVDLILLDEAALPASAFYTPRQRYIADSLLVFLAKANKNKYQKIIGVTSKDISTRKGDIVNWGILGLGSCPGEACVISSFRAGKNKVSAGNFRRRMVTLALHELGHVYGLEHCPADTCLMKDAQGKMNLDDGESYCPNCRNYLSGRGILK